MKMTRASRIIVPTNGKRRNQNWSVRNMEVQLHGKILQNHLDYILVDHMLKLIETVVTVLAG